MAKKVAEEWVKNQFANGKTVDDVLNTINEGIEEGKRVSKERFRNQCKSWGINLRSKPMPSDVEFVDGPGGISVTNEMEEVAELTPSGETGVATLA